MNIGNQIENATFNYIKLVHELSWMIELLETYHILNYKLGVNEPTSINLF